MSLGQFPNKQLLSGFSNLPARAEATRQHRGREDNRSKEGAESMRRKREGRKSKGGTKENWEGGKGKFKGPVPSSSWEWGELIQPQGVWEPQRQQWMVWRMAMPMQLHISHKPLNKVCQFLAYVKANLQTASASWPRRPSADTIKGVKWCHWGRQGERYFFLFFHGRHTFIGSLGW